MAREADGHVELPLGLIALYWIRMFKPLIERGLPQRPGERMRFVTEAFAALADVAPQDLRPGAVFGEVQGAAVRQALADAARLITDMPATHLTFPDDRPVFQTDYGRIPPRRRSVVLDQEFLWQFGVMQVPQMVWDAMRRMSAWIEPMLIAEWVRLTKAYAERAGRIITSDEVMTALRWIEPTRDTNFVRAIAQRRLARGEAVRCVWSGRSLGAGSLDIDHCLPWSAWPCGDLWNLLPASAAVNRHGKRERIVAATALADAKELIFDWWRAAYLDDPPLRVRFTEEARTTLPIMKDRDPELDDLFLALDFRRLRLRQDTLLAEWAGAR